MRPQPQISFIPPCSFPLWNVMLMKYKTSLNVLDLAWAIDLHKYSLPPPHIWNLNYCRNYSGEVSSSIYSNVDNNFFFFMKFHVNTMPVWCTVFLYAGLEVSAQSSLLSLFFFLHLEQAAGWAIHLLLLQLSCSIKFQSAPSFFVLLPKLISFPIWIAFALLKISFLSFSLARIE